MKIFVTGGAGFIGVNFINLMIEKFDNEIVNIDKLTYAANLSSLNIFKNDKRYKFYHLDINNNVEIENVLKSEHPDVVVNFAAESHVDRSIEDPNNFLYTNVLGTCKLLQSCNNYYSSLNDDEQSRFRFLHISTDEVYGSITNPLKFTEKTKYDPSSPYSASKAASDHFVNAWNKTYGLPTLITNCSNNYGPYQFPEKLIPLIIHKCINEQNLPIYGNGLNVRDWIHVYDHCHAIYKVLLNGKIGDTYNIGGNSEKKNIEIVHEICSIMDQLKPRNNNLKYKNLISYVDDRPGHDFRYSVDITKINKNLNWKPLLSFSQGLMNTVVWYLNNQDWIKSINNGFDTYKRSKENK